MRLARKDDLDRPARIGQESPQPFGIAKQQVGALVRRKAARESEGENVGGEQCARSRQFRRVLPVIPPTVTCFLPDVVEQQITQPLVHRPEPVVVQPASGRSEEHTSELQSRLHLVCRLLLEKKKKITNGGACAE